MTDISKEAVERVAAAIWPEIGTDYTYDEAVARANGLPDDYATQTYHQKAVKYAKDIARAAIAAMPDTKALEAADSISTRLRHSHPNEEDLHDAADHIDAQAARIAELEAAERKSRGYRVGHIAGYHAGIRQAAKVYREGKDWDVFATADCAMLALIDKEPTT